MAEFLRVLKEMLESGVRPDYIGIETYPGTASVPLDLSTIAAMLKAYHDLSGLPVMVTESINNSSRRKITVKRDRLLRCTGMAA